MLLFAASLLEMILLVVRILSYCLNSQFYLLFRISILLKKTSSCPLGFIYACYLCWRHPCKPSSWWASSCTTQEQQPAASLHCSLVEYCLLHLKCVYCYWKGIWYSILLLTLATNSSSSFPLKLFALHWKKSTGKNVFGQFSATSYLVTGSCNFAFSGQRKFMMVLLKLQSSFLMHILLWLPLEL